MLSPSSFRTTTPLGNTSIRYANDQSDFIASEIATPIYVDKNVGKWYVYGKENLRNDKADAPSGTEAPSVDYKAYTASYLAREYAFKELVLGKDARDFDRPVADLRVDAAKTNMDKLLIAYENKVMALVSNSSNYASGLSTTLTNPWSSSSSDPFEDIRSIRQSVKTACGKRANAIAFNSNTLGYLKEHPAIIDRLKYTGSKVPTAETLASLFEVDYVHVADAINLTSTEGQTDASGFIMGNYAVVYVKKPGQELREVRFMATVMCRNFYTLDIPDPKLGRGLGADWLESGWEWDLQFQAQNLPSSSAALAGGLISSVY